MVDREALREYVMKHDQGWHSAAALAGAIGFEGKASEVEAEVRKLIIEHRDPLGSDFHHIVRSTSPLVIERPAYEGTQFHVAATANPDDYMSVVVAYMADAMVQSGGARTEYLDRAAAGLQQLRTSLGG